MRSWALYLKGIVDEALTEGWILQLSNSSEVGGWVGEVEYKGASGPSVKGYE